MDQYPQQTPPNFPQPGFSPSPAAYPQGQPAYPQQSGYPTQPGYPQQPGYPSQPGYPAQPGAYLSDQGQPGYVPTQPPRKSRTGLWITIAVIALLLVGAAGGGVFLYQKLQNTPTATLQKFCDGYKTMNAQEIYNTFSSSMQAKPDNSEANIQKGFSLITDFGGKINDCTVSNVQQNGSTATATITITATVLSRTQSSNQSVSLIQENGSWKIDNIQS